MSGSLPNIPSKSLSPQPLSLPLSFLGCNPLRVCTIRDLSHNELTGSFPSTIGNLISLTYLSVSRQLLLSFHLWLGWL
ncbi:unnamed protein product [Closterium sp. NIES-53]